MYSISDYLLKGDALFRSLGYGFFDNSLLRDKKEAIRVANTIHLFGLKPSAPNRQSEGAEYDFYFDANILNRHPDIREERFAWQRQIYAAITMPLYQDALNRVCGSVFQKGNLEIDSTDVDVSEYFKTPIFNGQVFLDWATLDLPQIASGDPNGFIIVVPQKYEVTTNSKTALMPLPVYAPSNEATFEGGLFVWKKGGNITIIDNKEIYIKEGNKDAIVLHHGQDAPPVVPLPGNRVCQNNLIYKYSFFQNAIPYLDKLARQDADEEGVCRDIGYSTVAFVPNDCPTCSGEGSVSVIGDTGVYVQKKCNSCGGSGTLLAPGTSVQVPREIVERNNGRMPQFKEFYHAPTDTGNYALERTAKLYEICKEVLLIRHIEAANSGVAKAKDLEVVYKFYTIFARAFHIAIKDIAKYILGYITKTPYRGGVFVSDYDSLIFKGVSEFDVKNSETLLTQIIELQRGGQTGLANAKKVEYYRWQNMPFAAKKEQILNIYAPLRGVANAASTAAAMNDTTAYARAVYSDALFDLLAEKKGVGIFEYLETASFADIKKELDLFLPLFIETKQTELPQAGIIQSILANLSTDETDEGRQRNDRVVNTLLKLTNLG